MYVTVENSLNLLLYCQLHITLVAEVSLNLIVYSRVKLLDRKYRSADAMNVALYLCDFLLSLFNTLHVAAHIFWAASRIGGINVERVKKGLHIEIKR